MITRSLLQCLLILACCCCLNAQNMLTNPGFETDTAAPSDKPDYWHPRGTPYEQYHHVETNPAYIYAGSKCAYFNNTSANSEACYFYAASDAAGANTEFFDAEPDAVYEFSVKYMTHASFSGDGIYLEIFYYDKNNNPVGMETTAPSTSLSWNTLRLKGTIRGTASKFGVGIVYYGKGLAWVDEAKLIKLSSPLCKNGHFEIDTAAPSDKSDYWHPRGTPYEQYHHVETSYLDTYLGSSAALFNNTTSSAVPCYFYGPYDAAGATAQYIPVCPGDTYTVSGFGRVDTSFSGSGIRLALFFLNGSNYVNGVDSGYINPGVWTKITLDGTVPTGADHLLYSAEYSGKNKAWIDEVKVVQKNLVTNSSFETSVAGSSNTPDYWWPRLTTYHFVDNSGYVGSKSALFNNTSGTAVPCYFYGPADAASSGIQYMDVNPGETYTFSAYGKVDTASPAFTGNGLMVSIIFTNDTTFVSRVDSSWTAPTSWTQKTVSATVPAGANKMLYSVEYNGCNKAWFDKAELYKSSPWYYTDASDSTIEALTFTSATKPTLAQMTTYFNNYDAYFESNYNGDGSWGIGYGIPSTDYPAGHPLIRTSAQAVIGYLHAYSKIPTARFLTRAQAGLNWLVTQQVTSGTYAGAFGWWNTNPPSYDNAAVMYEGGLACRALMQGYAYFGNSSYLTAANNFCNYLLTLPAEAMPNPNGFAIAALAANYGTTGTANYLNKALFFMDAMCSYQLDSGMWSDDHDQYIWYHSIVARGLVQLLIVMPDSNPKKEVVKKALYKALNHIRRSQNNSPGYQTEGGLIQHPVHGGYCFNDIATMAILEAYTLQGITSLSNSVDAMASGIGYFQVNNLDANFAAIGMMLHYYY